jgi:predicted RNA-binding Zn-ribbon protein involved in translation (DUF1610 family)
VAVQSVRTGYETYRFLVKNLPPTATKAEVVSFFAQCGFDPAKFTAHLCWPNGWAHLEAVIEFEDVEDGKNAIAWLDEVEFGSKKLKLTELTKPGGMVKPRDLSSNILTVTWPAPSDTVVASYPSMEEASSKRTQLDKKTLNGRKVTATVKNPKKRSTLATVSISGLEPGTPLASIEEFCGTISIEVKNRCSYDINNAISSLQSLVAEAYPEYHELLAYETNLVPNEHSMVSAKIYFPTWEDAEVVRDFLDRKPLPLCGQAKLSVFIPDPLHYTIYVPYLHYKTQENLFQSLIPDRNGRSATTRLRIFADQPDRAARIELSGSDKKAIGKLKVRIEQLADGEKLPQWDLTFYHPEGERFLEKVYKESQAYIHVDKRQSMLKAFGEPAAVEQAKIMIQKEVDRLAPRRFERDLGQASVPFFMDGARGSVLLKQEVGEENVMLDVSSTPCKIVIRGGESARHCLLKLIGESFPTNAIRSRLQLKDGETCPVCYDITDQPYRLHCGHAYCFTCLNHFLLTASDTKKFPLSCVGDEGMCGDPIRIPVIQRFLLPAQVEHLLKASFLDYLGRNSEKFKYCATPGCTELHSLESDPGEDVFQCRSCLASVCVFCGEDHDGFSCEEWKISQDPEAQERLLGGWAEGSKDVERSKDVKQCPTCKILIEKNGGCNHMTCPKCDAHICWRCMGVFALDTIYGHMEGVHGGMLDGDEPDDILIW